MSTLPPPLVVWIVLDRKPGHRNLARGLAAAFASRRAITTYEIPEPAWLAGPGKLLQRVWPLGAFFCRARPADAPDPDLIIGSGGNVLWLTAAVARARRCPGVFVGSRRSLPADALTCFVHYDPRLAAEGTLCLPVLPGPAGRGEQTRAWETFAVKTGLNSERRHPVALIGGDGSGYRWSVSDGTALARLIASTHARDGLPWLIATSRRTPREVEDALRAGLPRSAVADACWVGQGDDRRVVAAYLGAASCVFVGEDSMSMIHESLSSGTPVITLSPAESDPTPAHRAYLDHACTSGWLNRLSLAATATPAPSCARYPGDVHQDAADAVLARLGLV